MIYFLTWWLHRWLHEYMTYNLHNYISPLIFLQKYCLHGISPPLVNHPKHRDKHTNKNIIASLLRVINTNTAKFETHVADYSTQPCYDWNNWPIINWNNIVSFSRTKNTSVIEVNYLENSFDMIRDYVYQMWQHKSRSINEAHLRGFFQLLSRWFDSNVATSTCMEIT